MQLKQIHFISEFNQSQWLKPYNECNTKNRVEAERNNHNFGRAFYKLMNNTI